MSSIVPYPPPRRIPTLYLRPKPGCENKTHIKPIRCLHRESSPPIDIIVDIGTSYYPQFSYDKTWQLAVDTPDKSKACSPVEAGAKREAEHRMPMHSLAELARKSSLQLLMNSPVDSKNRPTFQVPPNSPIPTPLKPPHQAPPNSPINPSTTVNATQTHTTQNTAHSLAELATSPVSESNDPIQRLSNLREQLEMEQTKNSILVEEKNEKILLIADLSAMIMVLVRKLEGMEREVWGVREREKGRENEVEYSVQLQLRREEETRQKATIEREGLEKMKGVSGNGGNKIEKDGGTRRSYWSYIFGALFD